MSMTSKLKVPELRAQLALRGLDTTGPKPALVQRLEEAEQQQASSVCSESTATDGEVKKRPRECQEDAAIERLRKMLASDLRKEAELRGVPADGRKADLVERIAADMEKDGPGEEGGKANGKEKEKMVTATKKGEAVLDQWLPEHVKAGYHVLQHEGSIYDAILNQTNVGDNNNKFYIIQALESDSGGSYMGYTRWGRVGVKGQNSLSGPYILMDDAIDMFETKFFEKTKNCWRDRRDFVCYPKKYTWLEMDYNDNEKECVQAKSDKPLAQLQPRQSQLDPRISHFISLICNISMMKQQMLEIGYNAEKLPLGKLSRSTILKGYDVLRRISTLIGKCNRKQLEHLSGEFYTVIPHDFGFKKMREFVIDTPYKLKCKLEMVEALGEIEIATKLLYDGIDEQDDPLYYHYQHLKCDLTPVEVESKEFSLIQKYLLNTHAVTHSSYSVDIIQIFKVSRKDELERFKKFSCTGNRMLLWHGSRLTNWAGILSQGLRIAPPEAPVTGYMFGKGVYFADMFSKSANYCFATKGSRAGVLLLCEVALGDMAELLAANYSADQLPEGKLSTKGVGETEPDTSQYERLDDGVIVPLGKPKQRQGAKGSLYYNEYIVYNVEQIRMRYLIQVRFNFK